MGTIENSTLVCSCVQSASPLRRVEVRYDQHITYLSRKMTLLLRVEWSEGLSKILENPKYTSTITFAGPFLTRYWESEWTYNECGT